MENLMSVILWRQYFIVLACILGAFYIVLVVLLYRRRGSSLLKATATDLQMPVKGGSPKQQDGSERLPAIGDTESTGAFDEEAAFNSLEELAGRIEDVVINGQQGMNKTSLLPKLQAIISNYPLLNKQPFKVAINNVIIKRSKQHWDIVITEEEVNRLWTII
jgi:hypothetical protein